MQEATDEQIWPNMKLYKTLPYHYILPLTAHCAKLSFDWCIAPGKDFIPGKSECGY